jgi:HK97 family phage major capsid protein
MSKELRELLNKLNGLQEEAKALMEKDGVTAEEIQAKTEEIKALKAKIEAQKAIDESIGKPSTLVPSGVQVSENKEEVNRLYKSAFLKALRGKRLEGEEASVLERFRAAAMSSQSGEDGGLLIPQDIQTMINELKRSFDALENYVRVEPVSTNSGSRVLEKNADMVPFAQLNEMGTIPETENPKFSPITYSIKDYGGILPIPNSLLADTDQILMQYIARWFSKKSVVTRNSLILSVLNGITKQDFAGVDDLKKALNVTLDPMIAQGAIVLTNQSGFNFLDTLKDDNGNYLLQPNPTNPTQKMLFGKPVAVVADRFLPNEVDTETKAPIIVGDLTEAVVLFDRQQPSLLSTNIGAGAFETNSTKVRAIERLDVKGWDAQAAVYGQVTLS